MATIKKEESHLADSAQNPLIGSAQAHIADASVAHALNATFSDTEVEGALNTLGGKINSILAALEAHGLVKAA